MNVMNIGEKWEENLQNLNCHRIDCHWKFTSTGVL